jgi:hemerythrin-like domain-containing protein
MAEYRNPFEVLIEDHRKAEKLFDELLDTTERAEKTRDDVFDELKTELDLHSEIEETILYPALEEIDETHDISLEAAQEHAVMKQLLEELEDEDKTTEEWTAKLTVLKENILHHIEEEENEMFPEAQDLLTEEQVNEIAVQVSEMKREEGV